MAEQENPFFFKGHKFDLGWFRQDLYRLVCYFVASESLASVAVASTEIGDVVEELRNEFFHDEVSRIMLQTASCVRVLLDESEAEPQERPKYYCGELEQPPRKVTQLTLREACNKIIHAGKINYDEETVHGAAAPTAPWHRPFIYLYGATHSGIGWKAKIDIVLFTGYCAAVLRFRTLFDYLEWERTRENR